MYQRSLEITDFNYHRIACKNMHVNSSSAWIATNFTYNTLHLHLLLDRQIWIPNKIKPNFPFRWHWHLRLPKCTLASLRPHKFLIGRWIYCLLLVVWSQHRTQLFILSPAFSHLFHTLLQILARRIHAIHRYIVALILDQIAQRLLLRFIVKCKVFKFVAEIDHFRAMISDKMQMA